MPTGLQTVGVRTLSGSQLGIEVTPGTAVPATYVDRGPVTFPIDSSVIEEVKEDVGIGGGTDRTNKPKEEAKLTWPEREATFEGLIYPLSLGIKNINSPSADGSGSGKVWAYPFMTTAMPTVKTATWEGYDNVQAYQATMVMFTKITLKWKYGESWKMSGEMIGQKVRTITKTPGLTLGDINPMNGALTKYFIDAIGGTIGTTQKSYDIVGGQLDILTGVQVVPAHDGTQLYYQGYKIISQRINGSLEFEHDADLVTEFANMQGETPRLLRVQCLGKALTTPGTSYSVRTANFDMPVKFLPFAAPADQAGDNIVKVPFFSKYNATYAAGPTVTVVNEVAAL